MNSPHTPDRGDRRPTFGEMLSEVIDLSAGLGIVLLPLLVTALPGVVLLLILPAVLLLAAAALPLALLAPLYLLVRVVRRRAGLKRGT